MVVRFQAQPEIHRVAPEAHCRIGVDVVDAQAECAVQIGQPRYVLGCPHPAVFNQRHPTCSRLVGQVGVERFVRVEIAQPVGPRRRLGVFDNVEGMAHVIGRRRIEAFEFDAVPAGRFHQAQVGRGGTFAEVEGAVDAAQVFFDMPG